MQTKTLLIVLLIITSLSVNAADEKPLPTSFYGQVLLRGNPYENVLVTARWIDNNGSIHATQTRTLPESEAIVIGNTTLKGFYFFNDGRIKARKGTNIVLSFQGADHNLVVPASPGGFPFRVTTVSFNFLSPGNPDESNGDVQDTINDYEETLEKEIQVLIFKNETLGDIVLQGNNATRNESLPLAVLEAPSQPEENAIVTEPEKKKTNFFSEIASIVFISAIIFFIFAASYLFIRSGTSIVLDKVSEITFNPLKIQSKRALGKKISAITKEPLYVSSDETCINAIDFMIRHQANIIFVVKNSLYVGYITERSILDWVYSSDKKISETPEGSFIQRGEILIEPDKTVGDAFFQLISLKALKLGVAQDNRLIGEIELHELQKIINNFSKYFKSGNESGLNTVRDVMDKEVFRLDKNESPQKAKDIMISNNTSIIIVTDEGKSVGIFNVADYLTGLSHHRENLFKQTLGHLMSPITVISPDLNIFEANEHMIKKGLSEYPVSYDNEILGIVSQISICYEIYEYIQNAASQKQLF